MVKKWPLRLAKEKGMDENRIFSRDCHGFMNPRGLRLRAITGTGMGWSLVTLAQPVPVMRAAGTVTDEYHTCDIPITLPSNRGNTTLVLLVIKLLA